MFHFSVYSVMHKYLTDRDEVNFDAIFDQKLGKFFEAFLALISQYFSILRSFFQENFLGNTYVSYVLVRPLWRGRLLVRIFTTVIG